MTMSISSSGVGTMPQVMSGASARMPPSQKMSSLFQQMDSGKTGSVTQQQFSHAFNSLNPPAGFKTMGAAAVFNQLDPNGTGSVSKQAFVSGMTDLMGKVRQQQSPAQSLASGLQSLNTVGSSQTTAYGGLSGSVLNSLV